MNILDKIKIHVQCFHYYYFTLHIYSLCIIYINSYRFIRKYAEKHRSADSFIFNICYKNHAENSTF